MRRDPLRPNALAITPQRFPLGSQAVRRLPWGHRSSELSLITLAGPFQAADRFSASLARTPGSTSTVSCL
jgi:hypothetical protein